MSRKQLPSGARMHTINVVNKHWYLLRIYWTGLICLLELYYLKFSYKCFENKNYIKRVNIWTFSFRLAGTLKNATPWKPKLFKMVEINKWDPKLKKILELINSTLERTTIVHWKSFNIYDCHKLLKRLKFVL